VRRIQQARQARRACDVGAAEGARQARRLTAELELLHERLQQLPD